MASDYKVNAGRRLLMDRMAEFGRELGHQQDVLEVGIAGDKDSHGQPCPGANREFFSYATYTTLDKWPDLHPNIVGDLCDPILCATLANRFDLVICSQVLEHVWDIHAAARGLYTMTRPGGVCIVDTPFGSPWHADTAQGGDYWRLTRQGMGKLLTQAGFGAVRVSEITNPHTGALEVVSALACKIEVS